MDATPVVTWFSLVLIACFIVGVLVAGGLLVAVVLATRGRPRPARGHAARRPGRPRPSPTTGEARRVGETPGLTVRHLGVLGLGQILFLGLLPAVKLVGHPADKVVIVAVFAVAASATFVMWKILIPARPAPVTEDAARPVQVPDPPARPVLPPLAAFKWPDDEKSRHGQRALAVLLTLLVAAGLIVILVGVIPKAGFGFNAVMLYLIALGSALPVIAGLLRWGFRQPSPQAVADSAPPPPAPPPQTGGASPTVIAVVGVTGVLLMLGAIILASFAFEGAVEILGVVAFGMLMLLVLYMTGASLLAMANRPRPEKARRAAAPEARPAVAGTATGPRHLGWLVGLPIAFAVVMGVVLTTANGGHIGVQRVDILLVGGMVAFGAFMLVRLLRQPAPGATPVAATPAVEAPVVPLIASPAPPRACPKCGRPIAAGAPEGLCPRCLIGDLLPDEPKHSPTTAYGPFVPPEVEEVSGFFPQLEIVRLIGQGGMGAVYLARQKGLDRLVALKLINVREDDPTFAERFNREAKAMGKLSHPNIVTIHDHGTADGLPYLVMEYVDGVTLRDAMRAKSLSPAEALKVIPQVCDALEYAHAQGVVHRDVKPENILLDKSGKVKIADFGLAKLMDPDGMSLTHTRQAMGTPHYMAPEQWERPTEVDHRADIYALGVLLYELLTGELPLGRFDPPSVKARVDARIDELVLRALAKEPGRRYQHASDMKLALANIARGGAGCRRSGVGANGRPYSEYRSKATLLGWPLVHVTRGFDPDTGRLKVAKGWIAVGDGAAIGGVAVGGAWACGGVAIGGAGAVGVIALGGGMAAGAFLGLGGGVAAAGGMAMAGGAAIAQFVSIAGGFAWAKGASLSGSRQDADFWQRFEEYWNGVWTDYLWPF